MTPDFSRSRAIERQCVEDLLRKCEYGQTVTYEAIAAELRVPVKGLRHVVYTVREGLKSDGYVFDPIRNVGFRRMTDEEISIGRMAQNRRKLHRQGRRSLTDSAAVLAPERMSAHAQRSLVIHQSLIGALVAVTTQRAVNAIGAMVDKTGKTLPVSEAIEAFRGIG